jgi:hypothetical protein
MDVSFHENRVPAGKSTGRAGSVRREESTPLGIKFPSQATLAHRLWTNDPKKSRFSLGLVGIGKYDAGSRVSMRDCHVHDSGFRATARQFDMRIACKAAFECPH